MKWSSDPTVTLDLVGPFRGECGLCGGPDARHRVFDALRGGHRAGDSVPALADDYGMDPAAVQAIVDAPEWRRPRRAKVPA